MSSIKLLEDPSLLQGEIDRRLETARQASPTKRREETLQRELVRLRKGIERLLTAYQEDLLSLDELRGRMPELRQKEQATQAELASLASQATEKAAYLRLAETMSAFFARLHENAQTLDAGERNKIVRLLIKDILVDNESIIIRHSIPMTLTPSDTKEPSPKANATGAESQSYLLRSGRHLTAAGESLHAPVCVGMEEARAGAKSP